MTTPPCPVGLVENRLGIPFQCGTCKFYHGKTTTRGACHNKNPELNLRAVNARWCCNLYKHQDMKTIVA